MIQHTDCVQRVFTADPIGERVVSHEDVPEAEWRHATPTPDDPRLEALRRLRHDLEERRPIYEEFDTLFHGILEFGAYEDLPAPDDGRPEHRPHDYFGLA